MLKCQEGKDFSFLIHCDSALWCIVKKKKGQNRHEMKLFSNYGMRLSRI